MVSILESGNQLHLSVLSGADISAIHLASLEILERTGVFVELPLALEMLRGAGATVEKGRARIPSFLVDQALRTAPSRVAICNRDGTRSLFLEGNRSFFTGIADCLDVLDPFSRTRHSFTSKDYRLTCRVIDASPNLHGAGAGGNALDYPPELCQQIAFKYSILNMKKTFLSCPLDAKQMADVYEAAAVIAGSFEQLQQAPFVVATAEPTTPLGIFRDASEILLLAARNNMPVVWYGMPAAGSTAPSTPAGTLAIGNAEILAGLVLHQLMRPGAPFIYGMMPSNMDMRSTQWAYGSPDFAVELCAATELAHHYRLPMYGTAGCCDSLAVDEQAASEATMLCLMGGLSGANMIHDVGLMGGDEFISPEMMVLSNEIIDMVEHATRPIETSQDELCLDLIDQVGPQGNYLALDHTLANFRRFWHSNIFLRNRLTGSPEDEPEPVAERINKKTIDIIENHQVDPLPAEVLSELEELEKKWMSEATRKEVGYESAIH